MNLLILEFLSIVVYSLNNFIDTFFVGNFLGTESMAAGGFFTPMLTIISLVWVVIIGVQILCGRYIGTGDKESLLELLATSVVFLGSLAIIFSAFCFFKSEWLAEILGAEGTVAILLQQYIKGYSFGIFGAVMCSLLLWFLAFNNNVKLSKMTIAFAAVINFLGNIIFLLVFDMKIFGLGLASSVSYLLSAAIILHSFFDSNKPIQLIFKKFNFGRLLKSARMGTPALTFNLGVTAKSYILNITLVGLIGFSGVAAMNVQGSVIGILGAFPMGFASAYMALGSIYFGAKDRAALIYLSRLALKYCIMVSAVIMALLMIGSPILPDMFFEPGEEAYSITERMLLLFPCFIVLNAFIAFIMKAYQFQKKSEWLVNSMPVLENILMAVLAATTAPIFGIDAVWLSFPAAELICLALVAVSVINYAMEQKAHPIDGGCY